MESLAPASGRVLIAWGDMEASARTREMAPISSVLGLRAGIVTGIFLTP